MDELSYLAIILRVLIALSTRTYFQPDEYFQSLEPAHHIVFGYGDLTWEWLASKPIRSIVYPAINVPLYWLLKVSGLSEFGELGDGLLIALPRILHGVLAALTDIYVGEIARRVFGTAYVTTTRFLSLASFFHSLALSRSLSNSLETSLSTIAFSFYPWDASSKLSPQVLFNRPRIRKMIFFAALACMVRPTNAVIWVYLLSNILWSARSHRRVSFAIMKDITVIGFTALLVLFVCDSIYYGNPTFTPINFLQTNLSSVSLFYGTNPWHFYLLQAVPILCTTALPFTLHGIWTTISSKYTRDCSARTVLYTILWSITVYSFAGHKEWRFLHPILPLLHSFAAKSLVDISVARTKPKNKKNQPRSRTPIHRFFDLPQISKRYLVTILSTIPASLYVILFYCSGPVEVLSYVRHLPKDSLENDTIGFIMPCHSTPGQAYLHRNALAHGRIWQLGCEPPLNQQNLTTYKDQSDAFFESPQDYLSTYFPSQVNDTFPLSPFPASIPGAPAPIPKFSLSNEAIYPWKHEWPRHLVFFGDLLRQDGVRTLLEGKGYEEVWRAGREWEGEGKRKGGVRVWKWTSTAHKSKK